MHPIKSLTLIYMVLMLIVASCLDQLIHQQPAARYTKEIDRAGHNDRYIITSDEILEAIERLRKEHLNAE